MFEKVMILSLRHSMKLCEGPHMSVHAEGLVKSLIFEYHESFADEERVMLQNTVHHLCLISISY